VIEIPSQNPKMFFAKKISEGNEMGYEILTELWGLHGYFVKDIKAESKKIFLVVERIGDPLCPQCNRKFSGAPKDNRSQIVEDLSVFGKRCYIQLWKFRIECECGYRGNESIEWLNRYERVTVRYQKWIYAFCKRMTGIDVARIFGISKHTVYRLDKEGIEQELSEQKPIKPKRLSIDEISRKKGHHYATIISAPTERKVLEVAKGRKMIDLAPFFEQKGSKWCKRIEAVSMDAWLAYRKAIKKYCKNAIICFDHFHLAQYFSKAIDKLRVNEVRKVDKDEKEIYKGTRWLLLKRPEKLNEDQRGKLDRLLDLNKNLYKAYILRDEFRQIFEGVSSHSRLIRLSLWKQRAKTVRISQITGFVKLIEKWEPFIRNSLREGYSNSFAEGVNTKVRVIQRMAYGYKDFDYLRLKIIQQFNFREIKSVFDG
jgi:transposase